MNYYLWLERFWALALLVALGFLFFGAEVYSSCHNSVPYSEASYLADDFVAYEELTQDGGACQ